MSTMTTTAATTRATMTEARRRPPARGGLATGWKSAILAASLGAVALGWSLLGRIDGPSAGQAQAAASQAMAVPAPAALQVTATDGRVILVPALPQRPVFAQPVARTRAS